MNDAEEKSRAWPATLSCQVGEAIRKAREAQNLSVVKLAARTEELGYPIYRIAIAKIEAGERDVTLPELVVLAAALNTVPLALAVPVTRDPVAVLPNVEMAAAAAIGWFTGTTTSTPAGVERDQATEQRLSCVMALNSVDERLKIQRELLQFDSNQMSMIGGQAHAALRGLHKQAALSAAAQIDALKEQRRHLVAALETDDSQKQHQNLMAALEASGAEYESDA